MDILIKILQLFMAFTLLVGIHELGHFIMARVFGIRVEKFYIFFDPWFSLFKFKRGDTEYGLGWLPLGGYVKIAGMIDESLDTEQMKQPVKEDEFRAKPAWQRFLVMIAGIVMNVLLAIVIYCGICYTWGDQYFANEDAVYGYTFNDAAHGLGFEDGDKILSIDGEPIDDVNEIAMSLLLTESDRTVCVERDGHEVSFTIPFQQLIDFRRAGGYADMLMLRTPFRIDSVASASALAAGLRPDDEVIAFNGEKCVEFGDYARLLAGHKSSDVALTVARGDSTLVLTVPVNADGKIGVTVARHNYQLRTREYTFWQSIPAGIRRTGDVIANYWEQLKLIVKPQTKMYEELGGFVAIGSIFPSSWDWQDFWFKTAFLSIILAIMNLLPIPGLDGGHALFTLWEIITRRKPSEKFLLVAQYVGLVIILALLIYANGNDIYRFFIK